MARSFKTHLMAAMVLLLSSAATAQPITRARQQVNDSVKLGLRLDIRVLNRSFNMTLDALDSVAHAAAVVDTTSLATRLYVNALLAGKVDIVSGKQLSTNDFTNTLLTKLNGISAGATVYTNTDARGAITLTTTGSGAASYNSSTGVINIPVPSGSTYTNGYGLGLSGTTFSLSGKSYSSADSTKLAGIATGATANSSDATLLNRANHTGTQAESTVTNLISDLSGKEPTITILPVNKGGTGTATPGIVAGTNVTVTGTWPNQTVNAAGGGSEPSDQVDTLLGTDHIDLWRDGHHYYATMNQISSYVVGYIPSGSTPEQQVTAQYASISGSNLLQANALQKFTDSATVHGYYDKIVANYPFTGNSLANKVYNMVNPFNTDGAFRLTLTSCSNDSLGIALTAGTSFADTHIDPSLITGAPYVGVGYYLSVPIQFMFLGSNGVNPFQIFQSDGATTIAYPNIYGQSSGITYTGGNVATIKFYERHSNDQVKYWSGGTLKGTDNSFSPGSAVSTSILLNKNNVTINATSSVMKDVIITRELTDTEVLLMQADRQMLMTDLGR